MKTAHRFASAAVLSAILFGCAPQGTPSTQAIEQNIASTSSGAFGKCIEHAYLAGMRLDEAKFLKSKIDNSVVVAEKFYYRQGEDASKVALEERKIAEQVCRDYFATQLSGLPRSSNVALNTNERNEIFFDLGSSTITSEQRAKLRSIVESYKQTPGTEVIITGRTDTTGTSTFNQALSTKRAVSVFEELKTIARSSNVTLPPSRIEVIGAGEVGGPQDNENRADRRVEVIIVPAGRASLGSTLSR